MPMDWNEHEELIRRIDVALYGVDLSLLPVEQQAIVKEQAARRLELEEMRERLNPKPKRVLSKAEQLEARRLQILEAKFDRVSNGRALKELSNEDLEKQLKILKAIAKRKGVS
ncbi:hypothetical protein [Mesobacillus maritimus]|uniref:Uncharacterized protein n=1 Tax=Mesobacillus maritimus TaxID=1643336 RepID=A0ABS7K8S9_9BACI|nr:hypothetical protein [Mesobacillus maritimus]MBY0098674.1 hypothetical protein [Mesobacillus maritimus]